MKSETASLTHTSRIEAQIFHRLLLLLLLLVLYIFEGVHQTLMPDWEELMADIEYTGWLRNSPSQLSETHLMSSSASVKAG